MNPRLSALPAALLAAATLALALAACGDAPAGAALDAALTFPDATAPAPDADLDTAPDAEPDTALADTAPPADAAPTADTLDATSDADDADTSGPRPPVTVSRPHWRLTFEDDFRGPTGLPSDPWCFAALDPQCHVWPGQSHDCDLSDVSGAGFFPPTRPNLEASIRTMAPDADLASLDDDGVKALYGQLIRDRLANLDTCHWTLYEMVNWMATDYAGRWSARFDASQVRVDPAGKGYLELSAELAPVAVDCVHGGTLGGPNCQLHAFAPGALTPGVAYWVDPDPQWPGVYYAPTGGACPHGGTFTGVNCQVVAFPPHLLEETGVAYWVDADPRWPGVFYANTAYRCRDNIDYAPSLAFRNLTCPILNGGVMSYAFTNRPWVAPDGSERRRGATQHQGRFEAKLRLPRGVGAFPAAWLMPESGGWPYDGGEIDVIEARDAADEVYQTYHHGRCYVAATGAPLAATDSADCAAKGGTSTHLSRGFTTQARAAGELWQRDHLFAVEWTADRLTFSINNVQTGVITLGTPLRADDGAPAALAVMEASNFPTRAFYWILNHSTWVAPNRRADFAKQTLRIDYVRHYVACGTDPAEYCPQGGVFIEGEGCAQGAERTLSPCAPSDRLCVAGGTPDGPRCRVWTFAPGELNGAVPGYWLDADPAAPGVYYAKIGSGCPYGGAPSGERCRLAAFPSDLLEDGVSYAIDATASPSGVFYVPDFRD